MTTPSTVWGLDALLAQVPVSVPGAYQLVLRVHDARLRVGALGVVTMAAGTYVYTGSALLGIRQRVLRHLRLGTKAHWHIDYLKAVAPIVGVRYVISSRRIECELHQAALKIPGAHEPVPGFGASDCRCRSHLTCLPGLPSAEETLAALIAWTPPDLVGSVDR